MLGVAPAQLPTWSLLRTMQVGHPNKYLESCTLCMEKADATHGHTTSGPAA